MHQPAHGLSSSQRVPPASARTVGRADESVREGDTRRGHRTPSPPPAPTEPSVTAATVRSARSAAAAVISPFAGTSTAHTKRATAGTKAAHNQLSTSTTTMKEFMPRTWQATTAVYSSVNCAAPPQVVMDPVALLRQCIRYFSSHPETYGTDIQGLLEQETLHVMRLKASELALVGADPVTFDTTGVALAQTSRATGAMRSQGQGGAFLPPLRKRPAAASLGPAFPRGTQTSCASTSGQEPLDRDFAATFGYGGISFVEPTPGFLALLEGATTSRDIAAAVRRSSINALPSGLSAHSRGANGFPAESIGWEGTLTEHDITAYQNQRDKRPLATPTIAGEQGPGDTNVLDFTNINTDVEDGSAGLRRRSTVPLSGTADYHSSQPTDAMGGGLSRGCGDREGAARPFPGGLAKTAFVAPIIVDGAGYETSFLRSQLQQLEAAYNAKSIRMHEMLEENASLRSRLQLAENAAASRLTAYNTLQTQLDLLRRELDGWKDKANDVSQQVAAQANKQSQQSRKAVTSQLSEAKQETAKLAELWRETERAYQESRRALENSEKEANHTHDHLCDAFHYIERLERRVARRNQYIDLCLRRQQSLEEKYEKMVWCLREVGTMSGVHSYADALLARDPMWTLILFTRLQRHKCDFAPAPELPCTALLSSMGTVDGAAPGASTPLRGVTFAKTPNGGLLIDDAFDIGTVYKMITDAVTAAEERRGGVRRLRTNLHGTVACRAARALLPNAVDYLGGEDSLPEGSDVNRRKLPLLTLASLVLSNTASTPSAQDGASPTQRADSTTSGPTHAPLTDTLHSNSGGNRHTIRPDLTVTVPNSRQFDQTTLRFLLRQFWKERLEQFMANMGERKEEAMKEVAERVATRSRQSPSFSRTGAPAAGAAGTSDDEEDEPCLNTFLAALVGFVNRIVTGSAEGQPGGAGRANEEGSSGSHSVEDPLLAVQLCFARNDDELGVVDNGRVAFATVDSARVRYPQTVAAVASDPAVATSEPNSAVTPGQARLKRLRTAPTPELSGKAHELLAALYYYAHEYKDSDADFRLFYLVAHQLLPEMVGINFYANMEAMARALRSRLDEHRLRGEEEAAAAAADRAVARASETAVVETDAPLDALVKVVRIVDRAPLVGEDVEFEVDSDGEGYGSILPGSRAEQTSAALTRKSITESNRFRRSVADAFGGAPPSRRARSSVARIDGPEEGTGTRSAGGAEMAQTSTAMEGDELCHNLRDYLATLEHRRNGAGFDPLFEQDESTEGVYKACEAAGWETLNDRINAVLGPHEELLLSYKDVASSGDPTPFGLRYQRDQRETYHLYTASHMCAVRGLLPLPDVLRVLQQHAFATYAVTCCGAPRYSLAETLFAGASTRADTYADPLDVIGQVPLTEWQLRRLRFALALDQPSGLVRIDELFGIDNRTSTPSHFYDEYLSLTLDLVQRQQTLFLDQLLGACAARHDRYLDEGAEECDGMIPVSFLKTGFTALFRSIGLGSGEAYAMVEHLVFYDSLLRHEDEVKLEQFTDAPFMINTAQQAVESPPAPHLDASTSDPARASAPTQATSATRASRDAAVSETDSWNVKDEMETCSLLHLILALRMTYVVWGTNARPFASTVAHLVSGIPIDAELETPQETRRRTRKNRGSSAHATGASVAGATTSGTPSSLTTRRGVWSETVVRRLLDRRECVDNFHMNAKVQYVEAAARTSAGMQGIRNPLRQAQQRVNAQAHGAALGQSQGDDANAALQDGSRKSIAGSVAEEQRVVSLKPPSSRDGGESSMGAEAWSTMPPVGVSADQRRSYGVFDRYSVRTSLLSLGIYPDLSRLAAQPPSANAALESATTDRLGRVRKSTGKKSSNASRKGTVTSAVAVPSADKAAEVADTQTSEQPAQSHFGTLNASLLSLARVLGLLTTSNAALFAATNDTVSSSAVGKKAKPSKKKQKMSKPSGAELADAMYLVTTAGATETLQDVRAQQTALLTSSAAQMRALSGSQPEGSASSRAHSLVAGQVGETSKTKRAASGVSGARTSRRTMRAVAFTEPPEGTPTSVTDTTLQVLHERRVRMDWAPTFGQREVVQDAAVAEDAGTTDGAKENRVLDVELLQQACAALSV